jgi:hypothetical protein
MHTKQPSRKSLIAAWFVMMGLSIGTMLTGRVTIDDSIGAKFMAALLMVTGIKALWILRTYLNLRAAPTSWNAAFISFFLILLLIIYGMYLVGLGQ